MSDEQVAEVQQRGGNYADAKDAFDAADGNPERTSERWDACPEGDGRMLITKTYREPEQYHFTGVCENNEEHNIERYGYYSNEGAE